MRTNRPERASSMPSGPDPSIGRSGIPATMVWAESATMSSKDAFFYSSSARSGVEAELGGHTARNCAWYSNNVTFKPATKKLTGSSPA